MPQQPDAQELLIRLDERTERMEREMTNFVTKAEFAPVRTLVFGAVGLILVSFMGALLYLTGISK